MSYNYTDNSEIVKVACDWAQRYFKAMLAYDKGDVITPTDNGKIVFKPTEEEIISQLEEDENRYINKVRQCVCGAEKCNTTHAPWCPLYRKQ